MHLRFGEGKYYTLQYEPGRPGTAVVEITHNETLKLVERHGGAIIIMTSDCYDSNLCHDVLSSNASHISLIAGNRYLPFAPLFWDSNGNFYFSAKTTLFRGS